MCAAFAMGRENSRDADVSPQSCVCGDWAPLYGRHVGHHPSHLLLAASALITLHPRSSSYIANNITMSIISSAYIIMSIAKRKLSYEVGWENARRRVEDRGGT